MSLLREIFSFKEKNNKKIIRILGIKFIKQLPVIQPEIKLNPQILPSVLPKIDPNNKVILIEGGVEKEVPIDFFKGLKIFLQGKNNTIKIHSPYNFVNSFIRAQNNCFFEIQPTTRPIAGTDFSLGENAKTIVGKDFSCSGATLIVNNISGNVITIGDDCMFGRDIIVRADDGHVICKKGTKEIINNSSGTKIGNHLWISQRAFIGKDVEIGDNSIVGACAVMTKGSSEQNVIWAGVPAKIVKRDIDWYRVNHNSSLFKK
jgi:acetyltransferase-like isoleucine patch superfamily enzyme